MPKGFSNFGTTWILNYLLTYHDKVLSCHVVEIYCEIETTRHDMTDFHLATFHALVVSTNIFTI